MIINGRTDGNACILCPCRELQIELSSGEEVARLRPNFIEIRECAKRAMVITGPAPAGSRADFVTRLFAPNLGVDEVRRRHAEKATDLSSNV